MLNEESTLLISTTSYLTVIEFVNTMDLISYYTERIGTTLCIHIREMQFQERYSVVIHYLPTLLVLVKPLKWLLRQWNQNILASAISR